MKFYLFLALSSCLYLSLYSSEYTEEDYKKDIQAQKQCLNICRSYYSSKNKLQKMPDYNNENLDLEEWFHNCFNKCLNQRLSTSRIKQMNAFAKKHSQLKASDKE